MTISPEQLAKSGTEDSEQAALFCWVNEQLREGLYFELRLLYATPNGGARDIRTATRLKATGVKKGVSDLFLPVSRHGMHGLFIELKKIKGGSVSAEQKEWGAAMHAERYGFCVCRGWLEARDVLIQYLS